MTYLEDNLHDNWLFGYQLKNHPCTLKGLEVVRANVAAAPVIQLLTLCNSYKECGEEERHLFMAYYEDASLD